MSRLLQNYLRSIRKKNGLSQKDIALLLGRKDESFVSRLELKKNNVSIKALIGYIIIFQTDVKKLFPGLYEDVRKNIISNVDTLAKKKCNMLRTIRSAVASEYIKNLRKKIKYQEHGEEK